MRVPLIDDIGVVPFSKKKAFSKIGRTLPFFSEALITELGGMMVRCGWTLGTPLYATGAISYPFGFTFATSSGSGDVSCGGVAWVSFSYNGATVARYSSYIPGQTPHEGLGCYMFQLGFTGFDSLSNLALRITDTSPFNATANVSTGGGYFIALTAKLPGPQFDYWVIGADGRYGIGDASTVGGGYDLKCGDDPANPIYEVKMTAGTLPGIPSAVEGVYFNFRIGDSDDDKRNVSYSIATDSNSPYYKIFANPYSFGLWDDATEFGNIAAFTPCIPEAEGFQPAYAVCVVGPGNLPNKLMWDGYRAPCTVCLDGIPQTFGDPTVPSGPGVPILRTSVGGLPLISLERKPFSHSAYLQMGRFRGDPARLVGKLWDCMAVTDVVPEELQIGGRNFVRIAYNTGSSGYSRGSLVFCIDDNGEATGGDSGSGGSTGTGGSGTGGGGASGGGGNGKKTGTVQCLDGVHVTWVSGDKFDASIIGQTFTVTGIPGTGHDFVPDSTDSLPVVATVTGTTALTTTHPLNTSFAGATYTCP